MTVKKVLCSLDEIPDAGAICLNIDSGSGGFSLILLRLDNAVYAYHNECPHAGRRLDWAPGKFLIEGNRLICAAHGASFVVESGRCDGGPCRGVGLTPIKVEVVDDQVRLM